MGKSKFSYKKVIVIKLNRFEVVSGKYIEEISDQSRIGYSMSDTYYGLSKMEYNLMKYFWNTNAPVSFSEVEKYCNTELHYGWAQPTLHTYLTRLVKKGILHSEGKGYKCKRSYYPELTEQELAHKYATDFVDNTFNGSISDLLVSLTYNTKLSESDIEELKNIINNNTCD